MLNTKMTAFIALHLSEFVFQRGLIHGIAYFTQSDLYEYIKLQKPTYEETTGDEWPKNLGKQFKAHMKRLWVRNILNRKTVYVGDLDEEKTLLKTIDITGWYVFTYSLSNDITQDYSALVKKVKGRGV